MKNRLLLLLLSVFILLPSACDSGNSGSEDIPKPEIVNIVTDYDGKAVCGKPVTIYGVNFSPKASENKVLYGVGLDAVSLRVTESSENHVIFNAPKTEKEQINIRVSVKGKESDPVNLVFDHSLSDMDDEPAVDLSQMLAKATTITVRDGVEWISFHGVWEGQIRNINIVKTQLNSHNRLGIYFDYYDDPDGRELDCKCEYLDALVGTNGPMACCHYVRVDGETRRPAREIDFPELANCAFTIDDNVVDIVRVKDNYDAARLPNKNVGCCGPLLVFDGKIQDYSASTNGSLNITHPRTAFGISEDRKTVIQVAVDGRWNTGPTEQRATGMEIPVLAKLMKGLGCHKAMNFDGGGGTAMWIYGYGVNGIVNHPCDAPMNWDNPTLRPAGNAVYIYSDLK